MVRIAHVLRLTALLMLVMACTQTAHAASAQFGVSLVIRESCEIRTDATPARPNVNCQHGGAFQVARQTDNSSQARLELASTIERNTPPGSAIQRWVVTF